ncbi:putative monooxygenase MoxC [compost metagenome]
MALRFSRPRRDFVGTPVQVADAIQIWFEEGASDGFIINSVLPDGLQYFTELVVPVLQQRGLFRDEYSGTTLCDNLGLEAPANRYTTAQVHEKSEALA